MAFLPLILMFILFAINVPVAFSLAISGMVYFIFLTNDLPMDLLIQAIMSSTTSYPMLAIPFFITAGVVMSYAGISKKLMDMAEVLTGHMQGGLGQVNILLSVFMGGISGSPIADCAFEAKVLVPEMEKKGYSKAFSSALTAASSVITPIIPPGICLILYATVTNQSIGDMFMAGYIPGILMGVALMITVWRISKKRGYLPSRKAKASWKEIGKQAKSSVWALIMPFGIIMGLRMGWFTPTECGAICVLYSVFLGIFIYRELKIKHIPRILIESVLSTASVMFIMCCAGLFSKYLNWEQIPSTVSNFLLGLTDNKYIFLLIVNALLLFMGMFFDANAALVIFPPLLAPVAQKLGIDLVQFGIIMCMNITIGGVTPPFGILMFTAANITKVKVGEFIREALPLLGALIAVLLLVTYIPGISLFLIRLLG
ncbi:TRAP transporter large permease subunit [Lactonifactor sp. BIOML-A3]|uniref:TRAP transporter large permease n=1 Tax=Lactonifactor TaxID=420345 RepID=UPI0012AFB58D|nr:MULTISPECIES: TRAP transporter large permease [Lactonifactor]MCB5713419.1 TRAP transporter large permease [Lactonifactor longoviformis]MCB5716721.1 TRAP transporter large permease [Lactonifactor longoviformis]MSA01427.1 TRAP transporter large permease subunit [Lactonifactor sp. BIOML-A5]MSA08069.1 TRAP transporter large permease subunit [Lactonifactor sp. BIOML-A4]MSA12334.1 TRAP transporter large permease subunit [Lactonifactor sp. BIOML-A3]